MLQSLQIGFCFVRAAVACGILERTSGLEPLCETTASRFLKLGTVPSFCPFTLISFYTLVYNIMLSRRFCSQVNLKPAFVVSDLKVSGQQQNCCGSWELLWLLGTAVAPGGCPLILTALQSFSASVFKYKALVIRKKYRKIHRSLICVIN